MLGEKTISLGASKVSSGEGMMGSIVVVKKENRRGGGRREGYQ